MTTKNLQLALRHLTRQKLNTTLHIVGLTLGMSVCLLIALFIRHELSFDTYHANASRTYRINSVWSEGEAGEKKDYHFSTPLPLADAIRHDISGLEHVSLIHPQQKSIIEINPQKRFQQEKMVIVEPDFLNIFTVEAISGNPYQVLRQPYQALLTESTAKKFFGNEDPIGKTFKLRDVINITVGGLIKDFPGNTQFQVSMLLSYVPDEKYLRQGLDGWSYVSGTETYVVLPEKYDINTFNAQLKAIADKHINSDPRKPKFFRQDFDVQPLGDIHFNAKYAGGGNWVQAVDTSWLWFFTLIGLAVLTLACINFMNLSTAQALNRAKEVGVRKSVGAGNFHLINQFLTEAWMLALISGILSIVVAQIFLPFINTLLEKEIAFQLTSSPILLMALAGGVLLTGLLAGIYPAWIISRFNPATTLKSSSMSTGNPGSSWLRKGLVVAQFTISAGLLIAVSLISQQVDFLRNQNLGFDKDNVVNVELKGAKKAPAFANELRSIPQVKDVSFATATPSNEGHWGTIMSRKSRQDPERKGMTLILADDRFSKMYGFELKTGRFLEASDTNYVSKSIPEDQQIIKAIVNETLVRELAFDSNEDAIGERIHIGFNSGNAEIVGVVKDFNTGSLHNVIKPTFIAQDPEQYGQAGIKIEANSNIPQTIAAIEAAWKKVYSDGIFEYKFLDEQIDSFYKAEERLYNLFRIFAALAMLISCLGLWGLATFAAQQRTKEIGIRKVLGASVNNIVTLLSKDFVFMVLVALIISCPIAYYLVNNWLLNFAYHINIGWQVFVLVGMASLFITLATVCIQALRAAFANPVNSLRNE